MKNFLSKLWSLSRTDRVRTLAIDAVSLPSFCRVNMLKLVSVLVILLTLGVGNAWGVEATFNLWQTAPGSPTTNNNVSFAYSRCVFGASNANAGFNVNGQVVATMPTGATVSKIVVHKTSNSWAKKANLKVYYGNTLKQTITQPSSDVTINLNGSEQTAGTYMFKNEGSDSKVAFVKSIVITYTVSECSNPEIGTQPASATYTVGDSPTALSVTASGTSLTYQWYSNTTATNTGGTIIIGQTSSTYTPSIASNGTFYYYCVVSSGSCSTNSNVATITVNKASATIKLSEAGAESTVSGTHYSGDSYTLPSSTEASCGSKVLVGWSTVTISETDTKPTSNYYDKGASVTLAAGENKFYAVFATESGGDPVSISGGDMAFSLPSGWSSTGTDGFYSNNGVKFNSTGDYILSGDISSHGLTSVTVKFKAGYNGSEGSVLRIEAIDEGGYEIGGVNFTPTEAYNAQSTINSVVVSASGTIYRIAVEMTSRTSNVCVKYCEVFKGGTTYSAYSTTCCNQLAAPANPGETPNSTGAVLTWDAVTGATGYEVKIDGGEWTSTGNGTTTGYTITGKTCGGTSVSWQVRATGDGSTNCAKGAATAVQNFSTTSCACTATYSFHWYNESTWHPTGGDANICFHDTGDKGDNTESTYYITDEFAIPVASMYKVGWEGSDHWDNARTAQWGFQDMPYELISGNPTFGNVPYVGYIAGALGYIRIRPWYTGTSDADKNKHPGFIPSAYTLQIGTGADNEDWSNSETLVLSKQDPSASYYAQYWQTEMVTLTSDRFLTKRYWVGLKTSSGYVWCGRSQKGDIVSNMPIKTGADTWGSGVQNSHAGQKGRFVLDAYNNAMNWNVRFVPYWEASYDANGGGAVSTTATNVGPVSCEGGETARQVTMPAAPNYEHHEFDGWLSSADAQTYAAGATVSLTQNTTFTAQWHNASYNISATMTNVTSGTSFPVTYTYTGSAANVTYTFVASSGYRLPDAVTVTMGGSPLSVGNTGYTWDKTTGQLQIKATITADVAITIGGTQTHTVTWLSNGSNYVTPVTYDHGGTLALPAGKPSVPGSCSGSKVFVGWTSDSEITSETTTAPTLLSSSSLGPVTADATYRAVFAERGSGGGGNTYTRLTAESELYDGMPIVIVAHQNSGAYLQQTSTGITKYTSSIPGSSATSITVTESTLVWTLVAGTGDNSGKWHLAKDANNRLVSGSTPSYAAVGSAFTFEEDQDEFLIYSGSCYCLEYYGNTPVWKFYSPSNCNADYSVYGLWLYGILYTNYITQCSPCLTPSEVTASDVTNNSATISWSGVSQTQQVGGSGTGFTVLWGTDATRANNNNTANVAAGTTTYNLTGLSEGTHYYVWVQSKCDDSWCATPADFTTLVSHTATFYDVDGTTPLQSGSVIEGSAITYSGSTPVSCDAGVDASTTFVGWASAPWSGKLAKGSIPSTFYDIAGGESLPNMGNSNMSFYPVFAKATGDPLTNHVWEYTFTTNKYGNGTVLNSGVTKTLDGTDNAVASNKDWTLQAYGPLDEETWEYANVATDAKDNTKGIKIGTGTAPAQYMYFNSSAFTGTIKAVKISTSGGSMTQTTVGLTVDGTDFLNSGNATVYITNSNTEYSFTGSKTISGDEIAISWYQATTTTALYIKKIEVDYTTGGDISYSNYMTTCSQCVTPNSVTADAITEAGATINWAGTSKTGTTGFTVLWGTDGTRANNSNSANVDADTKTYSITGLSAGTTYYVWVQSRCDGTWSDRISFTTLAVHDITFTKDNGTLSVASPVGVVDGQTLTFPNVTSTSCGTFVGWKVTEVSDYDNVAAPSPLYKYNDTKENITADESYQAVYRTATGAETNVTDNITIGVTGVTGNYADFTGATASSSAVYTGNVKKDDTRIQMRNSSNSGIVTTTSGGLAKKVTFNWAGSNTSGRIVDVYGKNTAYSSAADLYSADAAVQGTKIGSITYGTSTELTISTDYNYIGIRAKDGAAYASSIDIIWYGTPMSYMTAPTCDATVGITASFSAFTYVYGSGPSAEQSFMVSGINLSEALVVTAPTNYEVCKTADGTYTSSVSFTPAAGKVSAETVYIRLAAGLNVGTYNYDAANGVSVASNSATPQTAALNGSVTKAAGTIAFTDFNAVDHYEAELEKGMSDIDVTLTVSVTGDGSVSYSKSPAAGVSPTIPATQPTTTLHVLQPGIWTVTATLTAGTNYTGANTNCEVRVKRVDTYVDFIHNKTIKAYGSGSTVVDGKMEDWGSGYTVPYIDDNATETSGSCQQTHFKFMGWVVEDEINIADGTFKTGWTLIEAGTASKTATTKTYYAVWAKLED